MRILITIALTLVTSLSVAANLTTKDVEKWIEHAPTLQEWIDQQDLDFDEDTLPEDIFDKDAMADYGINHMKKAGLYDELSKRTKKAGYDNVEEWVKASQQISMAYMAVMLESQVEGEYSEKEILEQKKELAELEIPAERKAMMESMLDGMLVMLKTIESTSPADKSAVKPYINELSEILGDDE